MAPHWFLTRHGNVYIYVPNLIGYARVASAFLAFGVALHSPALCVLFYFFGFVCDELDGRYARMLNQISTLGVVLDMVTDRLSTAGLLVVLTQLYPRWYGLCLALLILDIWSHWFQTYATLVVGGSTHKDVNSKSRFIRFYYGNRIFMGMCCISCETLYLSMYLLHWATYRQWPLIPLALPAALTKLVLLQGGAHQSGLSLAALIALLSIPGFIIKQFINVVQLRTATQQLVRHDREADKKKVGTKAK